MRRLQLIGGDQLGIAAQWQMLDTLFEIRPITSATSVIVFSCVFFWIQGLRTDAEIWMLSSILVFLSRAMLSRAYTSRFFYSPPQLWITLYFIAAALTGLQWGLGGLVLAHSQDATASSVVFGVEAALMGGAASRGYVFPIAVTTQVNITLLMLIFASVTSGQYIYVVLMTLYVLYQTSFITSIAQIKLKEINSENQRQQLVEELAHTNEQLSAANASLSTIANMDALTGVSNRRSFDREFTLRWTEAVQNKTTLSLLLIDVDHFKRFNDTHGHQAGDKCLALVAAAIKSVARHSSDHAARYGGEEFALILPETDLGAAKALAEQLAAAIRSISVPVTDLQGAGVTVSIGTGSLKPDGTSSQASLIAIADQALYRAKQDGRDCVR